MKSEDRLTTADLAQRGDDMRGHHRETVVNRDDAAVIDTSMASKQPAAAEKREPARVSHDENKGNAALFAADEATRFRHRWADIQTGFVDEPRRSVEQADSLVAEVMKRLADMFAKERAALEQQWDRGDKVTTEDLRVALQRYRSFFDRLLSI